MDIKQLKYFIQVADDMNYSSAGKKLSVTSPALFAAIKRLEDEIEAPLFIYENKHLLLTPDGRDLYERAQKLIDYHNEIINFFMEKRSGRQGSLRIGISQIFATGYFAPAIVDYTNHYPDIKLNFFEGGSIDIQKMVLDGTIDIGIVVTPLYYEENNFKIYPIFDSNHTKVLVCSKNHRLAAKETVSYADLKNERFIMLTDDYSFMKALRVDCMKEGFAPNVVMQSALVDFILEIVPETDIITILPSIVTQKYNYDTIAIKNFSDSDYLSNICLITDPDYVYEPGINFIDFITEFMNTSTSAKIKK